jgi:hypothetical protein
MSAINGHDPLAAAIEQAQQQQAAEQMLRQVLNQALNQPVLVTRVTGPSLLSFVTDENGNHVLLVAMPNGSRWDIPIDAQTAHRLADAISAGPPAAAAVVGESAA